MTLIKSHSFNRRKYQIRLEELDGICDTYKLKKTLSIYRNLKTRVGLVTTIHEALHAECWNKSEKVINRVSKEIGNFLWRLGYRKVK